jgi:hypothetical protein
MKRLLVALAFGVVGYKAWGHFATVSGDSARPLYPEPYLVVYGRETCGFTMGLVQELERAGVAYEFQSVDDRSVADVLHKRMDAAGIDTRRYNLPVVDLNNTISIRPESGSVIGDAKELSL